MQSEQCCADGPDAEWKWAGSAMQAVANTMMQSQTSQARPRTTELPLRLFMELNAPTGI